MDSIRLNHYIARCGKASRRGADKMIEDGRVMINGAPALIGARVNEGDVVELDGEVITPERETVVLAVYKPVGVVCTEAHFKNETTLQDLLDYPSRVFSIGRLDKDSEGLILMTNDGALATEVAKASNAHEKEYYVRVNKPVTADFLDKMRKGVDIVLDDDSHHGETVTTRPCVVKKMGVDTFSIILTQGFNRQIRRMCKALGVRVLALKRVRVMDIELGKMISGNYRKLSKEEIMGIKNQINI